MFAMNGNNPHEKEKWQALLSLLYNKSYGSHIENSLEGNKIFKRQDYLH